MTTTPAREPTRRSPVRFDAAPGEVGRRGEWDVVLEYQGEGDPTGAGSYGAAAVGASPNGGGKEGGGGEQRGPWVVDLSHRLRLDYQDLRIDERRPLGLRVPARPGEVSIEGGLMINRMNRTQVSIWHVGPEPAPDTPQKASSTDTTDSHCWLAVVGAETPSVMERVSNLDLFPPGRRPPFLTQGPVLHVACQIVTCGSDGALISVGRGYGQTFTDAMLHAAGDIGLRPGGERVFTDWWRRRAASP